jgi:hypothetical protein
MFNLRLFLKSLKKKPESFKQSISLLVFLVVIPAILFFWFASLKNSFERASMLQEQEFFGQKLISGVKSFFGYVWQGLNLFLGRMSELWQKVDFSGFFRSLRNLILGKPKIEFLAPDEQVNLPVPTE